MQMSSSSRLLRVSDFCRRPRPSQLTSSDEKVDHKQDEESSQRVDQNDQKVKVSPVVWNCPCSHCMILCKDCLIDNSYYANNSSHEKDRGRISKPKSRFYHRKKEHIRRRRVPKNDGSFHDLEDDNDASLLEDDPCSVAHVSLDVLKALSLPQGSLASVSYHNRRRLCPKQQRPLSILVRLRLLPQHSAQDEIISPVDGNSTRGTNLQLFLSPTAATNLGLAWEEVGHGDDCWIEPFHPDCQDMDSISRYGCSHTVSLRLLGRHPHPYFIGDGKPWPNFLSSKKYHTTPSTYGSQVSKVPYPSERYSYLVQPGAIISSFFAKNHQDDMADKHDDKTACGPTSDGDICLYEVVSIDSSEAPDESFPYFMTTPCTKFQFEMKPPVSSTSNRVRRLPPLLSLQQFYNFYHHDIAACNRLNDGTTSATSRVCTMPKQISIGNVVNEIGRIPPHPNRHTVQQALFHAGGQSYLNGNMLNSSNTMTVAEHVVPVIGNDVEHDLVKCVETASHQVGMQCLSVRCGLAAFGDLVSQVSGHNRSSSGATGSLRDTMMGLQAAVDMALTPYHSPTHPTASASHDSQVLTVPSVPCVLHLYDIDSEWTSSGRGQDDQMRCEQEERFWTIWKRAIAEAADGNKMPHDSNLSRQESGARVDSSILNQRDNSYNTNVSAIFAPRLILVISMQSRLKHGGKSSTSSPWLERLVIPEIAMDPPDREYVQYLWSQSTSIPIPLDDDGALELLIRRQAARDVKWLSHQVEWQKHHAGCSTGLEIGHSKQLTDTLAELCRQLDVVAQGGQKTSQSGANSNNNISRVRWSDVGGLASVRQEIMDAIELPLHHPHLFPQGGGRSGLLLYGKFTYRGETIPADLAFFALPVGATSFLQCLIH